MRMDLFGVRVRRKISFSKVKRAEIKSSSFEGSSQIVKPWTRYVVENSNFLKIISGGHASFCEVTDAPVLDFW